MHVRVRVIKDNESNSNVPAFRVFLFGLSRPMASSRSRSATPTTRGTSRCSHLLLSRAIGGRVRHGVNEIAQWGQLLFRNQVKFQHKKEEVLEASVQVRIHLQ